MLRMDSRACKAGALPWRTSVEPHNRTKHVSDSGPRRRVIDTVFELANDLLLQFRWTQFPFGAQALDVELNGNNRLCSLGVLTFRGNVAVAVVLPHIVYGEFLFGQSRVRRNEAKPKWSSM